MYKFLLFILYSWLVGGYQTECNDKILSLNITNGSYPLMAGQNILSGTVSLNMNNTYMSVRYHTINDWKLSQLHLWIGTSTSYPQTATGNPKIGQFPFNTQANGTDSYTFLVNLSLFNISSDICTYCTEPLPRLFIMSHAVVYKLVGNITNIETAWGYGTRVSNGSWAMMGNIMFTSSCEMKRTIIENQEYTCDTGVSRSSLSTCFLDLGYSRWGWTNGPLNLGSYPLTIWTSAAQCDTNKGYIGGYAIFNYDISGMASITAHSEDGYWFDKIHIYIGSTEMPSEGTAFGLYPIVLENIGSSDYSLLVNNIPQGEVYLIAHFEVCHFT